jgi:hypothetical protein
MIITNMLSKKITLWSGVAMVKNLILHCGGEEFKSPPFTMYVTLVT